ncbi:MAG: hypothetical protein HFH31_03780 [Bacilli bacterium]|nr:hypothetical protein [Bacilli bacterium]
MAKYRKYNSRKNTSANEDFWGVMACLILFAIFIYWKYVIILVLLALLVKSIIFIHDRDLFSKFKEVKLYYQGDSGEKYLARLEQEQYEGKDNQYKINCLNKGLLGEKRILYTLSHIENLPMYIMHDVNIEYENFKAQIDFIVITKKSIYIIEAKDLKGNIDIEKDGTFTRIIGKIKKGIKNPLTQNRDHEKVIKSIFKKEKIHGRFTPIVVLANDNTSLHFKRGANKYENLIFRNDKLEEKLIQAEKKKHIIRQEEKMKKICDAILKYKIEVTEVEIEQTELVLKEKEEIIEALKDYRKKISTLENIPAYMVYKDETIFDLAKKRPTTIDEFNDIVGLGEQKIKQYGEKIIEIINE